MLIKNMSTMSGVSAPAANYYNGCQTSNIWRRNLSRSRESTGSRGDVFVVRTSNPSKTSEKMGYFDRVTVSLRILLTANQETEGSQDRLTV